MIVFQILHDPGFYFLILAVIFALAVTIYNRRGEKYIGLSPSKGRSKLLYGRQKCYCSSNGCIGSILVEDLNCLMTSSVAKKIAELAKTSSLNGVLLFFNTLDKAKVLRRLESKLVEIKILLERKPVDKKLEERLKLIKSLVDKLYLGRAPLDAMLIFIVRADSNNECLHKLINLENHLSLEGCTTRSLSFEKVLEKVIKGERGASLLTTDIIEDTVEASLWASTSYSRHAVYIGREIGSGLPVYINLWDKGSLHTIVVGPTGKGKTTLLALLALRVYAMDNSVSIWVFDPKGDLAAILSSYTISKVLGEEELYGLIWYGGTKLPLAFLISHILGLSVEDTERLNRLLKCTKEPYGEGSNFNDLMLMEKLKALGIDINILCRYKSKSIRLDELMNSTSIIIVDLSSLNDTMRSIVLWIMLFAIIEEKLSSKRKVSSHSLNHGLNDLDTIIIIDEAWRLKKIPEYILHRLFKEGRSLGLAVVLASQDPEDIPEEAWNNSSNIVAFGSQDEIYIKSLKHYMSIDNSLSERIKWLRRGEAIIRSPHTPIPMLIAVDAEPHLANKPGKEIIQ